MVREAEALRADFAVCLRALSGQRPAPADAADDRSMEGCEALATTFIQRAKRLRTQFAVQALRVEHAPREETAESLQAEVDALRAELAATDALLERHRGNLQRWRTECLDVEADVRQLDSLRPRS